MSNKLQRAFSATTRERSGIGNESLEAINQMSFNEGVQDELGYLTTREVLNATK